MIFDKKQKLIKDKSKIESEIAEIEAEENRKKQELERKKRQYKQDLGQFNNRKIQFGTDKEPFGRFCYYIQHMSKAELNLLNFKQVAERYKLGWLRDLLNENCDEPEKAPVKEDYL